MAELSQELVSDLVNSLRTSRWPLEVLEHLSTALVRGLGECKFSGYFLRGESLSRIYGDCDAESLAPFERTEIASNRLAVACRGSEGPIGAFVLLRDHEFSLADQKLAELLGACAALALQKGQMTEELTRLVRTDALTGIANRRFFFELADREWSLAKRHQSPLSLILLDVDHLKRINDLYGQEVGDEVLRGVGQALATTLRNEDILARYGGEEFVMLLPRINLPEATWGMSERLRKLIEEKVFATSAGEEIRITVSLGVSTYDAANDDVRKMLRRADDGVSMAKTLGRNRCVALDLELIAPEP